MAALLYAVAYNVFKQIGGNVGAGGQIRRSTPAVRSNIRKIKDTGEEKAARYASVYRGGIPRRRDSFRHSILVAQVAVLQSPSSRLCKIRYMNISLNRFPLHLHCRLSDIQHMF